MSGVPPNIPIGEIEWYTKYSTAAALEENLNEVSSYLWTVFEVKTLTGIPPDHLCYQIVAYKYNEYKEPTK